MTTQDSAPSRAPASPEPVRVLRPGGLDDAVRLLAAGDAAPLGGGVGHTLRRRGGRPGGPAALVAVAALPELRGITWAPDHVRIGAGVRLAELAAEQRLAAVWPAVTEAAGSVATGRIRRLVTLGGNIAARDDSYDPPVALAAVGATLTLRGPGGTRTAPAGAPGEPAPGDLLVDVRLPLPPPGERTGSAFEKFLDRGVWEYACVHVAAAVGLDGAGRLTRLSLAVGSVAGGPVVIGLDDLLGAPPDDTRLAEAARRAAAGTRPYGDVRGSAAYKSHMIAEFARRAVTRAADRAASRPGTSQEAAR